MSLKNTNQKGFTIVELLIVIVVIAILAAISIVAFTGVQQRGRDSQRAADAANIAKALTALNADGSAWPVDADAAKTLLSAGGSNISNLGTGVTDKIQTGAVTAGSAIQYRYQVCPASGVATGAIISYYKEQGAAAVQSIKVGTGTCPTA